MNRNFNLKVKSTAELDITVKNTYMEWGNVCMRFFKYMKENLYLM